MYKMRGLDALGFKFNASVQMKGAPFDGRDVFRAADMPA